MKKIVVYSSKTGNTKKIGEAIADELGCKAVSFDVAKDIDCMILLPLDFM